MFRLLSLLVLSVTGISAEQVSMCAQTQANPQDSSTQRLTITCRATDIPKNNISGIQSGIEYNVEEGNMVRAQCQVFPQSKNGLDWIAFIDNLSMDYPDCSGLPLVNETFTEVEFTYTIDVTKEMSNQTINCKLDLNGNVSKSAVMTIAELQDLAIQNEQSNQAQRAVTLKAGEDNKLICDVAGFPNEVTYTWENDGVEIQDQHGREISITTEVNVTCRAALDGIADEVVIRWNIAWQTPAGSTESSTVPNTAEVRTTPAQTNQTQSSAADHVTTASTTSTAILNKQTEANSASHYHSYILITLAAALITLGTKGYLF